MGRNIDRRSIHEKCPGNSASESASGWIRTKRQLLCTTTPGKSDLLKSLRRKVKAYPNFPLPVKLIVLHDQDSNDCIALKNRINGIIDEVNPGQPRLIRIACHELENWYLGDPDAIEQVYPTFKADRVRNRTIFRMPDRVVGSNELERLIPDFAKTEASRIIPVHMNTTSNRSVSFGHFVSGVKRFLG